MATITGTSGNDSLLGTSGDDTIEGLAGNDTLRGNAGNDLLDGGAGTDSLDGGSGDDRYIATAGDVLVDSGGIDTIFTDTSRALASGFENITYTGTANTNSAGNSLANAMTGNSGNNRLDGRDGNDTLIGGSGRDTLIGGNGNDFLDIGAGGGSATGGAGQDTFYFADFDTGLGRSVNDYTPGVDKILLDASVYTELGADGNLSVNDPRFYAAPGATGGHDADDRIIFDTTINGYLYYDPDGSGPQAAQLIAHISGRTGDPTATDFAVINGATGGTIAGTNGNDTLTGTSSGDTIDGLAGDDLIYPGRGNDLVSAGDGDDAVVMASDGSDGEFLFDRIGNDTIDGGDGIDSIGFSSEGNYTSHSLTIDLNAGTYTVADPAGPYAGALSSIENAQGSFSDDHIRGSNGANFLAGAFGRDTIEGLGGDDHLQIESGEALLLGDAGNDTLDGGGPSTLAGGLGNDVLNGDYALFGGEPEQDIFLFDVAPGDANADTVTGFLSGTDRIVLDANTHVDLGASGDFGAGDARFFAGADANSGQDTSDRVVYNTTTGQLWYDADGNGAGTAQLIATLQGAPALAAADISVINGSSSGVNLVGTTGADTLTGTSGNDTMSGLEGNDLFISNGGNDVISGGPGSDSITYNSVNTPGAIVVNFASGTITGGFPGGSVSFTSVERVVGSLFNDSMSGAAGNQNLTGAGGNDTVWGAGGFDTLWGGNGADTFTFREMGNGNADRISDFAVGGVADTIALDDSSFTQIGAPGEFAAGDARFHSGAGVTSGQDSSDRVIYNATNGNLYYDADGSGAGAAQLVATLTGAPTVAATDITVI